MYLDTEHRPATETEALFIDLDKPSLRGLSYVLRRKEAWPKGFVWNYDDCHQCAMGMAHQLWKEVADYNSFDCARALGISIDAARLFFLNAGSSRDICESAVTPEMVADDIDDFLKQAESK